MVKFNRHNVTKGTLKARVSYSLDNNIDGQPCVTIYAKDYGSALARIMGCEPNGTDSQTDYFEKDRARLRPSNPLYAAARATATAADAAWKEKYARTIAAR